MSEPGSRLQGSVKTFGPLGRVVATGLVLVVLWWYLQLGVFGLVGAVIWGGYLLPWALRDIWRRAVLPSTDLTLLRDQTARELAQRAQPQRSHLALDPEAKPPTRW